MNTKKIIALILALVLMASFAAVALTGCGGNTDGGDTTASPQTDEVDTTAPESAMDSYVTNEGKLVIGMTIYKPMNYYEGTELVGFDTEFAEAVCAKIGLTPEFIEINWETKETELKAGSLDCIWNGLTVSEERRANMDFSTSYLINKQVIVVKADKAADIKTTADLADMAVVAEAGSAGETAAKADANLAGKFTPVSAQSTAIMEVSAGTADAAVVDITMAKASTGAGTDYNDLVYIENIQLTDEEYAVGLRKDSPAAIEQLNNAIAELVADGTLAAIAEKYDLTDLLAS